MARYETTYHVLNGVNSAYSKGLMQGPQLTAIFPPAVASALVLDLDLAIYLAVKNCSIHQQSFARQSGTYRIKILQSCLHA